MTQRVNGTCKTTSWDEASFAEVDELRKLTTAAVTFDYAGDITGTSIIRYLMTYHDDGSTDFVALERVTGTLDGHEGSFTVEQRGKHDINAPNGNLIASELTIVPGSGAGDLTGISGSGSFIWKADADHAEFTLDYDIAKAQE